MEANKNIVNITLASKNFSFTNRLYNFEGIPLTIQSNRPSSRSSQRSSGSIGSYAGRRSSGAPHSKGVNVSQSRQGAARSAAILLYSYHLNVLTEQASSLSYQKSGRLNELRVKYIEQQLEDQKKMLLLDIPALRNHNSLMRKLRLNPRSEIDLTQLEKKSIGNSPFRRKLPRPFLKLATSIAKDNVGVANVDERSGVDELFVNKSTDSELNCSSESHTHDVSFITDGGYTNPLAFYIDDLDDGQTEDDSDDDGAYGRSLVIDDQEIFFGAMPSPVSEAVPSIAV